MPPKKTTAAKPKAKKSTPRQPMPLVKDKVILCRDVFEVGGSVTDSTWEVSEVHGSMRVLTSDIPKCKGTSVLIDFSQTPYFYLKAINAWVVADSSSNYPELAALTKTSELRIEEIVTHPISVGMKALDVQKWLNNIANNYGLDNRVGCWWHIRGITPDQEICMSETPDGSGSMGISVALGGGRLRYDQTLGHWLLFAEPKPLPVTAAALQNRGWKYTPTNSLAHPKYPQLSVFVKGGCAEVVHASAGNMKEFIELFPLT